MAPRNRNFKTISADYFQFDTEGKSVEGTLVHKDSVPFHRADVTTDVGKYTLETDEGERVTFLGGTVIDQTLETVELGTYLRITFTGERKTNNNMMVKQFQIEMATA